MNTTKRLQPRKKPAQARSKVTIDAILTASIQVLLRNGLDKFTTTRVAERTGVSVGTLYQYFPNKEALLYALLLKHFEMLAKSFETIPKAPPMTLEILSLRLADAYIAVKMANVDETKALYMVAGSINQSRLTKDIFLRLDTAIIKALESVTDARFEDTQTVSFTLLSALAGLSRSTVARETANKSRNLALN